MYICYNYYTNQHLRGPKINVENSFIMGDGNVIIIIFEEGKNWKEK